MGRHAKRWRALIAVCCMVMIAMAGCKGIPDDVVGVKDMASLLADMHTAEAVVEIDMRDFPTDSAKQALKQSVLMKYGVSQAQFDTSMMWYGRNIDKYIEVYDEVIKILEERSQQAGAQIVLDNQMAEGDSVDVWGASRYVVISPRNPSHMLSFDLPLDTPAAQPGDMYTWRIKILDGEAGSVRWQMMANYADSTCDYLNITTTNSSTRHGWNEVTFILDSMRTAQRLRGIIELSIPNQTDIWVDSISLLRKPLDPDRYRQRTRQRRFTEMYPLTPKPAAKDSVTADTTKRQ